MTETKREKELRRKLRDALSALAPGIPWQIITKRVNAVMKVLKDEEIIGGMVGPYPEREGNR